MAGKKASREQTAKTYYKITVPYRLVHDEHFAGLLEKLGRGIIGKELPHDPTVAKIIARAVATTKILSSPRHLSVPDAESLKEFLNNAEVTYVKAHPPRESKRRGQPSKENLVMAKILQLSHELGRKPTYGEMFPRTGVSKTPGNVYAKLYRLSTLEPKEWPDKDRKWLLENYGKEVLTPEWWWYRRQKWFEAFIGIMGLADEIRRIFKLSPSQLQKEIGKVERQRLKILAAMKDDR
jgi:hypothetical protein